MSGSLGTMSGGITNPAAQPSCDESGRALRSDLYLRVGSLHMGSLGKSIKSVDAPQNQSCSVQGEDAQGLFPCMESETSFQLPEAITLFRFPCKAWNLGRRSFILRVQDAHKNPWQAKDKKKSVWPASFLTNDVSSPFSWRLPHGEEDAKQRRGKSDKALSKKLVLWTVLQRRLWMISVVQKEILACTRSSLTLATCEWTNVQVRI